MTILSNAIKLTCGLIVPFMDLRHCFRILHVAKIDSRAAGLEVGFLEKGDDGYRFITIEEAHEKYCGSFEFKLADAVKGNAADLESLIKTKKQFQVREKFFGGEKRVVCAAMTVGMPNAFHLVIVSPRHWDSFVHDLFMKSEIGSQLTAFNVDQKDELQGFMDNHGNFLTREAAFTLAEKNNQIVRLCGTEHTRKLYSENLY